MPENQKTLAIAVFTATASIAVAAHAQTLCEREIRARLDELRIERTTVTNIYANHVRTLEGGSAGITGRVSLESCRGKVVLNKGSSCRVFETYTTGECRVPGLSSY
jgi:hypothetical protein